MLSTDKYPNWLSGRTVRLANGSTVEILKDGEFILSSLGYDWHFLVKYHSGPLLHKLKYRIPQLGDTILGGLNERTKNSTAHVHRVCVGLAHQSVESRSAEQSATAKDERANRIRSQRKARTKAGIQAAAEAIIARQGAYICNPWNWQRKGYREWKAHRQAQGL